LRVSRLRRCLSNWLIVVAVGRFFGELNPLRGGVADAHQHAESCGVLLVCGSHGSAELLHEHSHHEVQQNEVGGQQEEAEDAVPEKLRGATRARTVFGVRVQVPALKSVASVSQHDMHLLYRLAWISRDLPCDRIRQGWR
jgi:hypothetical protein